MFIGAEKPLRSSACPTPGTLPDSLLGSIGNRIAHRHVGFMTLALHDSNAIQTTAPPLPARIFQRTRKARAVFSPLINSAQQRYA